MAAMARFASFCEHDPVTDCVLWRGGTTTGRGHTEKYGAFWYNGRRWFAHRWAAKFIHGLEIDDQQVDHCCPYIRHPNTLCVNHVQSLDSDINRFLQTLRSRECKCEQTIDQRRYWLYVQVGLEPPPPSYEATEGGIPFHELPGWLEPFKPAHTGLSDCPF